MKVGKLRCIKGKGNKSSLGFRSLASDRGFLFLWNRKGYMGGESRCSGKAGDIII